MKRVIALTIVAAMMLVMIGCATHLHIVGDGAQTGQKLEARQWYALWGLVPISTVDTNMMSGGAQDYTIKTQQSFLDIVINIFTGLVTIYSRTVTVTK